MIFNYEPDKPLARYKSQGMILGVCSGLARKFGGDVTYYRIGSIIFCIAGGSGIIFYLLVALVMPSRD